jgi:hypothetical protein
VTMTWTQEAAANACSVGSIGPATSTMSGHLRKPRETLVRRVTEQSGERLLAPQEESLGLNQ